MIFQFSLDVICLCVAAAAIAVMCFMSWNVHFARKVLKVHEITVLERQLESRGREIDERDKGFLAIQQIANKEANRVVRLGRELSDTEREMVVVLGNVQDHAKVWI